MIQQNDTIHEELREALRFYRNPRRLETLAAANWPAVTALISVGLSTVDAIRKIIEDACEKAKELHKDEVETLVEAHYFHGQHVKNIANEQHFDRRTYYRKCDPILNQIASLIEENNREILFNQRYPVFGGDPTSSPSQSQLPIFGFRQLAEEIREELLNVNGPAVIIIQGIGGVGKTTLAQLVISELPTSYFEGIIWTSAKQFDFDPRSGVQNELISTTVSAHDIILQLSYGLAIGIRDSTDVLLKEIRARCKNAPYLIVIDNLETLREMEVLVRLVEQLVIPSRVIITSRERIHKVFSPQIVPGQKTLGELDKPASYELLRAAARRMGTEHLAQANDGELDEIYSVTGGMPLALWLVVGQVKDVSWDIFKQELKKCPKNSTGEALYDFLYRRSWDLLSQTARTVLFAMHRHKMGADYHKLRNTSGVDEIAFRKAIEELSDRMLLMFNGRMYYIHRLTYTFLRTRLVGWS